MGCLIGVILQSEKSLFRGTSIAEQGENCVPSWHFLENTLVSKLS